jgi:hypothetical protein
MGIYLGFHLFVIASIKYIIWDLYGTRYSIWQSASLGAFQPLCLSSFFSKYNPE